MIAITIIAHIKAKLPSCACWRANGAPKQGRTRLQSLVTERWRFARSSPNDAEHAVDKAFPRSILREFVADEGGPGSPGGFLESPSHREASDERGRQLRRPYAVFFRVGTKVERRAVSFVWNCRTSLRAVCLSSPGGSFEAVLKSLANLFDKLFIRFFCISHCETQAN